VVAGFKGVGLFAWYVCGVGCNVAAGRWLCSSLVVLLTTASEPEPEAGWFCSVFARVAESANAPAKLAAAKILTKLSTLTMSGSFKNKPKIF
jgi:hypothetical protein